MFSSVKYSRLGNNPDDPDVVAPPTNSAFSFDSIFEYEDAAKLAAKYKTNSNYNSAFKWNNYSPVAVQMGDESYTRPAASKSNAGLMLTSWILTFLSYIFFFLTSPVTYFFFVKKLGEFDRLVVFRLGKMIGVKGPGRVVVFPWMDRTKRIDVRAAAFAVPPQQFITCDGGIVEMGAEIQYGIVDVVTMVSEVADHQDILRSLGKTLLVKLLVKKTVPQLERDKRAPAQAVQDELNDQVRMWGIDVQKVELSELKVLKQPDNSSNAAVGSILKGLGMKGESAYPTPEEFVRAAHGLDEEEGGRGGLAHHVSAANFIPPPEIPKGVSMNMSLLQMMTNGQNAAGSSATMGDTTTVSAPPTYSWGRCLEIILQTEFVGEVEEEARGIYEIEITGVEAGTEKYYIELTATSKVVRRECFAKPDVSVRVSSPDLSSILDGSLAPLNAYLTGRIGASGDIKKLMLFDKLSKRGHKQGALFSV